MVATVEPRVEIDDRIRENPTLLEAITNAMAFLGHHVSRVPLPAAIWWRFLPLDPTSIELLMSDTLDFSDTVARRVFRLAELDDIYTREVGILRTYGELLRLRSHKRWQRINRMMRTLRVDTSETESDQTVGEENEISTELRS